MLTGFLRVDKSGIYKGVLIGKEERNLELSVFVLRLKARNF